MVIEKLLPRGKPHWQGALRRWRSPDRSL